MKEKYTVMKATPQSIRRCSLTDNGWQPDEYADGSFVCILNNSDQWLDAIPPFGCIAAFPLDNPETWTLAKNICNTLNQHLP